MSEEQPVIWTRRARRWLALWAIAVVAALAVIIAGQTIAAGGSGEFSDTDRQVVEQAAAEAVTALMTFTPDDAAPGRGDAADHLTGTLAATYAARGADAVVAGAVAEGLAMAVRIVDTGIAADTPAGAEEVRVLVFADQFVGIDGKPPAVEPDSAHRAPIARWAQMRKVDGQWLLADLDPVGAPA